MLFLRSFALIFGLPFALPCPPIFCPAYHSPHLPCILFRSFALPCTHLIGPAYPSPHLPCILFRSVALPCTHLICPALYSPSLPCLFLPSFALLFASSHLFLTLGMPKVRACAPVLPAVGAGRPSNGPPGTARTGCERPISPRLQPPTVPDMPPAVVFGRVAERCLTSPPCISARPTPPQPLPRP
eukprot:217347-Chlamydomonas_euryale.AAC.1